jgi:hypothetical protein
MFVTKTKYLFSQLISDSVSVERRQNCNRKVQSKTNRSLQRPEAFLSWWTAPADELRELSCTVWTVSCRLAPSSGSEVSPATLQVPACFLSTAVTLSYGADERHILQSQHRQDIGDWRVFQGTGWEKRATPTHSKPPPKVFWIHWKPTLQNVTSYNIACSTFPWFLLLPLLTFKPKYMWLASGGMYPLPCRHRSELQHRQEIFNED